MENLIDWDKTQIYSGDIFKYKKDQKVVDPPQYNIQSDMGYTKEETRDIEDRLRQLGYIE